MGQICSRRKVYHSKKTDEAVSDAVDNQPPSEPISESEQFVMFLKKSGIQIAPSEKLVLDQIFLRESVEEKINIYLSNIESFGDMIKTLISPSCEIQKVRLPIAGFDFVNDAPFIPSPLSSSVFKPIVHSRTELVHWYLHQTLRITEKKTFLAVVVRLMLGKRPKADLDDLETDGLSDPVALLFLLYNLLEFSDESTSEDPMRMLLTTSGSDFLDQNMSSLPKLRSILGSEITSVLSLLPGEQEFPQRLLRDLLADPTLNDLLSSNTMRTLRVPANSRRDKHRAKSVFLTACKMVTDSVISDRKKLASFALALVYESSVIIAPEILAAAESVYAKLPTELEGDSGLMDESDLLERHIEIGKLLVTEFKFYDRISFSDMKTVTEWNTERRELTLLAIIRQGLKQWTDVKSVFTHKAAEDWWVTLTGNVEILGSFLSIEIPIVHRTLVQELILVTQRDLMIDRALVFRSIKESIGFIDKDYSTSVVRNIVFCSDIEDPIAFVQSLFPQSLTEQVHKLSQIRALVSAPLLSTATGAETNRGLVGMIQQSLNDSQKKKRADLVARMLFCDQRILNLLNIESLITSNRVTVIFETIFAFNPNAFLETTKIKELCKLLSVSGKENAFVLHLACAAYTMVREREGAMSLVERLLSQYQHEETWRLAAFFKEWFGECPPHVIAESMKICPADKLDEFARLLAGPMDIVGKGNGVAEAMDYLTKFPDLGKQAQVDEYLRLIGDDNGMISFEDAEALAAMDSLVRGPQGRFSSLATLASIGCF